MRSLGRCHRESGPIGNQGQGQGQERREGENAIAALSDEIRVVDEITSLQSFNWQLENTVRDLGSQQLIRQNEVEKVKSELENVEEKASAAENTVRDLGSYQLIRQNEVEKLKFELENVEEKASAAEVRVSNAERALIDLQETTNTKSSQWEEEMKAVLDEVKREAAGREKAIAKAFKLELESIKFAVDAAKWLCK